MTTQRIEIIDHIRASAIILMIIFHLMYDLTQFKFIQIDFYHGFWFYLPRFIVFLFLICVGISLRLSHINGIQWRKFNLRLGKLVIFAALISLSTWIMYPDKWVYFGILHCIAATSVIALPFVFMPRLALGVGIVMLVLHLGFDIGIPFYEMDQKSIDYIPVFPWVGVVLIGIFVHYVGIERVAYPLHSRFLNYMSRHSLIIYLIHQPIMFSAIYLVRSII